MSPMTRTILFFFAIVFPLSLFAQEVPPAGVPVNAVPPRMSTLPPMSPSQLLRMRQDLTFQLQESQRVLALIGTEDKQLVELHQQQQKEIVEQLKDIETQLTTQRAAMPGVVPNAGPDQPTLPPGFNMMNPTLPPSAIPGSTTAESPMMSPANRYPGSLYRPYYSASPPSQSPAVPQATTPLPNAQPAEFGQSEFDQSQAWANSPWAPQPSKELSDMKNTVEALRREIDELKNSVKALEAQIQLLNRNILLTQPPATAQ